MNGFEDTRPDSSQAGNAPQPQIWRRTIMANENLAQETNADKEIRQAQREICRLMDLTGLLAAGTFEIGNPGADGRIRTTEDSFPAVFEIIYDRLVEILELTSQADLSSNKEARHG